MTGVAAPARPRVLVVDDEIGPRESLRILLKPDYEIETADSARAGLAAIPRFRPEVVILDIKMPTMDGLEGLRRVKELDPTLEVVMITAYASLDTVKQALSRGAFEYLIKPFARADLESVVARAVARRRAGRGASGEVGALVEQMRRLTAKTSELEDAARRDAPEHALRATQLSLLREIGRSIVGHLDLDALTTAVGEQLRRGLGYDRVTISLDPAASPDVPDERLARCLIRDAQGPLGHLVVDNRPAGRTIDHRERELLEMLAEYLAVAVRNSRLYGEVTSATRRLEQLIASAGDAIVTLDATDRVQGWNPAAERIFGLPAAGALGRPVTRLLPEAPYAEGRRRLDEGAATHAFEVSGLPSAGGTVDVSVTLSALRGPRGVPEGVVAIVRDVTLHREVEQQLRQSEKLTALGQLAGGIAHDFNNLLQAILGYSQLMKQRPGDVRLVTRSLQIMEIAAQGGSETVRRIQQFARLRPDEPFVSVDLNEVIKEALAITRPRWEESRAHEDRPLELELDLGPLTPISGRPAALTEMFTNLVLNAIDAMPAGGTLSIATRAAGDGGVLCVVADTGVGMSEPVLRRVFEPFFSTKGESGSGLGLAMVYSIVRRHGGEIRVDSEPGRGATFTLTFPPGAEVPRPVTAVAPEGARRTGRVLVVDDDAHVLDVFRELLESLGYATTAVSSGAAALAACARSPFDVVLTNVGMPGMNGWQFAERLREIFPELSLIFLTGWGLREQDMARLDVLGARSCLFKPVKPDELDAAIQSALAG